MGFFVPSILSEFEEDMGKNNVNQKGRRRREYVEDEDGGKGNEVNLLIINEGK